MRTKALLCAAAFAAGIVTSMAQSNVYSLNVVGYYNVSVPANAYKMLANQLVQTNSTVPVLFAGAPDGTTVMKWTGTGFQPNTYDAGFGEWSIPDMTVVPGEGFFVKAPAASAVNLTFVGEVNQNTNTLNFTAEVYKMVSIFTPQAGLITTDFGFPAGDGDAVLQWAGTGYTPASYDAGFGEWTAEPNLAVGEGFFMKTKTTKSWTRSFKVQ